MKHGIDGDRDIDDSPLRCQKFGVCSRSEKRRMMETSLNPFITGIMQSGRNKPGEAVLKTSFMFSGF